MVTPINAETLNDMLIATDYDDDKRKKLVQGFVKGFDIGYRGPTRRKNISQNIPLHIGSPTELWNKIMKEVQLNRYAGPYQDIPYRFYVQSPIGLVPKAGNKTRLIFHLSFDFGKDESSKSINYFTPSAYSSVKYKDLDHAVRTCLRLKEKLGLKHGDLTDIHLAKTDIVSAFRILPVLPEQRKYLLMHAKHPVTGKTFFFVEKNVSFGGSASCALFQSFSDVLHHIIEKFAGKEFTVTNYLDDLLFISKDEQECNALVRLFIRICENLGCPVSEEKTVYATQDLTFLGILLDSNRFLLLVPEDKRCKALHVLNWAYDHKKVTIKHVQRITGLLNFLNKAIVPGRVFTRSLYDKMKVMDKEGNPLNQYHHITLTQDVRCDIEVWRLFLNNVHGNGIARPFVDVNGQQEATTLNFYTDASLSKSKGLGGIFNDRWICEKWGSQFIIEEKPSIQFLELFALAAGILTWGHLLQNTRIIIFCDNKSVRDMVNSFTTKCPKCLKLLRLITLDGMMNNRRIFI